METERQDAYLLVVALARLSYGYEGVDAAIERRAWSLAAAIALDYDTTPTEAARSLRVSERAGDARR